MGFESGSSMGVGVTIDIDPSPYIMMVDFNEAAKQIRSFREPMKKAIQTVISPSFVENFDVGGRPTWAPLADSTLSRKEAKGAPPDILIETSKLRTVAGQLNIWSIEGGYLSENATAIAQVTDLPGAEYGRFHQSGTTKMPERVWADLQDKDLDETQEIFADYVYERMNRIALRGI